MNEIIEKTETLFKDIKHIDEEGNEYWEARELQKVLDYKEWRKFNGVIEKAKIACENSNYKASDCFVGVDKPIISGKGKKEIILDYHLSRYACYLIAQNGDSRKKVIALAQTYFAVQTRKQEILDEYEFLPEDSKRRIKRKQIRNGNYELNRTAVNAGVKNLDKFDNAGYKGLYGGEIADDIAKRKSLRYREDILDNMGSDELIANLFIISLMNQRIKNDNIKGESTACNIHYTIGENIREVIIKNGGTVPEKLPTPKKSIKVLEKEELKKITGGSNHINKLCYYITAKLNKLTNLNFYV